MSRWFNIAVVLLFTFWLTCVGVTQSNLTLIDHQHTMLLAAHEADLTQLKMTAIRTGQQHPEMLPKMLPPFEHGLDHSPCTAPCKVLPVPPGTNLKPYEF